MARATLEKRLAALGFAADWSSLSGDSIDGYSVPIDAIGRTSINGECRGIACFGQTRRELYLDMLREAKSAAPYLEPCIAPDCEFHGSQEPAGDNAGHYRLGGAGLMAMTNAERQAAWRERQKAKLAAVRNGPATDDATKAELARLRAENAELRAQLDRKPRQATVARSYLERFEIVARKLARHDDRARTLRTLRNAFVKMDRGLCALEQAVGLRDQQAKRAKVQALLDRPGYDGERTAAAAAMARLDTAPDDRDGEWSVTRPEPLPNTRDEMLARKRKRS